MRYYKITLENGENLYYESKGGLSDSRILRDLVDQGDLDPIDAPTSEVEEINEEEYEENCY
jgi:hypothetical protein